VASLEEREAPISSDWFTFWLGHFRDQDGPAWRDRGWEQVPQRLHSAGQGFFHMPTQTLFLQHIPDVDNPKVAFKMLNRLLNEALERSFSDAPWVIEVRPDVESVDFLRKLREASQVVRFHVHMPVPNARAHDLLRELQGLGGHADADHVDVTLHVKRGSINRSSGFVSGACRLLERGVASIKAWVYYGERQKGQKPVLLASDDLAVVREHDVPQLLPLSPGQPAPPTTSLILERDIGFLTDDDVEEVNNSMPPPHRKPRRKE
jgi:hypothetical protein